MARLDEMDRRRRQRTFRKTYLEILALISGEEGLARLRQVDDQRWDEAQALDDAQEPGPAG